MLMLSSVLKKVSTCMAISLFVLTAPCLFASEGLKQQLVEQATPRLVEYLQINTVNPPGNETRGAEYFAKIFDAEGIPYQMIESAPGRGNIVARLKGGDEPGITLLHHIDVVPFDEALWEHPPLAGNIVDGIVYGRGAVDMKNVAIIQLQAFLYLHRSGLPLKRDVVFVATADEEAGGHFGLGFLVKEHRELFEGIGFSLNEGGGGVEGDMPQFSISVIEKTPLWLRVTAKGTSGHGSTPTQDAATKKLLAALSHIPQWDQPRVLPVMREYLQRIASSYPEYFRERFLQIDQAVKDPAFIGKVRAEYPPIAARLSNTCSINGLQASAKVNVISSSASAEVDCRLLPDQDPDVFKQQFKSWLKDDSIEIEEILRFAPSTSSMESELFVAIEKFVTAKYPSAKIIPTMTAGFTDSHWLREIGIVAYGFIPSLYNPERTTGFHANNERIAVDDLEEATANMIDFLVDFAVQKK